MSKERKPITINLTDRERELLVQYLNCTTTHFLSKNPILIARIHDSVELKEGQTADDLIKEIDHMGYHVWRQIQTVFKDDDMPS